MLSILLQIASELPEGNNWNFDVHWYPKCPGVISASSFDGNIGIYNIEVCAFHERNYIRTCYLSLATILINGSFKFKRQLFSFVGYVNGGIGTELLTIGFGGLTWTTWAKDNWQDNFLMLYISIYPFQDGDLLRRQIECFV